jgi:hypothetical protein
MVQGHEHHDRPAQQIDGIDPGLTLSSGLSGMEKESTRPATPVRSSGFTPDPSRKRGNSQFAVSPRLETLRAALRRMRQLA